jgi:Raf kinase inhibitor-like YbhB/YbcL family protein
MRMRVMEQFPVRINRAEPSEHNGHFGNSCDQGRICTVGYRTALDASNPMRLLISSIIIVSVIFQLSAQDAGRGASDPAPRPIMKLTVQGFSDGGQIPVTFAQPGPGEGGTSPAMSWVNVPVGTQSFLLNMHDTDMSRKKTTDDQAHWVVWNIPGTATGLPEGVPKGSHLPDGSYQVSLAGPMYLGPGAPANVPFHHYVFDLYALDTVLDVKPSAGAFETRANVVNAIQGHILAKAVYWGLFRRPQ